MAGPAWGANYIDAPVVRWYDCNWDGNCDSIQYYTYDGNFNVTALVKTDGSVFERYAYDAYGAVKVLEPDFSADPDNTPDGGYSGAPYGRNEILYCGYRRDPESGLYCVRNRYYHPALGRWINRDPMGYKGSINLYEYVNGRSTLALDPTGLFPVLIVPRILFTDSAEDWNRRDETLDYYMSYINEWLNDFWRDNTPKGWVQNVDFLVAALQGKLTSLDDNFIDNELQSFLGEEWPTCPGGKLSVPALTSAINIKVTGSASQTWRVDFLYAQYFIPPWVKVMSKDLVSVSFSGELNARIHIAAIFQCCCDDAKGSKASLIRLNVLDATGDWTVDQTVTLLGGSRSSQLFHDQGTIYENFGLSGTVRPTKLVCGSDGKRIKSPATN